MAHGRIVSMKTQPGKRDDFIAGVLDGLQSAPDGGCLHYSLASSEVDEVTVWITEIWETEELHDDWLAANKEKLGAAMSALDGAPTSTVTHVVGGLGISA